jgi:radical S-adenosyl methionine domain-containing protein 2
MRMQTQNHFVASGLSVTAPLVIDQVDELTINWHVTEACNYHCQYCYAHWRESSDPRELFHDRRRTRELLEQLFQFFQQENTRNPLTKRLAWKRVRLNLAGGEPSILGDRLLDIVRVAREIGFQVSIISNGSRLSRDMIELLVPHLSCLGISLDSADSATNRQIGRVDRRGRLLDFGELAANLHLARLINPQLTVKLNTVVNRLNADQDLSVSVRQIAPNRWKILRMLPVSDASLAISDEQFSTFVDCHQDFEAIACVEDNQDMCESYLMVDPNGRFFQNQTSLACNGYVYSKPILTAGVESAFSEIDFNSSSFQSRYTVDLAGNKT